MELTDAQKIEKLWGSLERSKQAEASLQLLLQEAEDKAAKQQSIIEGQQATINELSNEIRRLGIEINKAREAAANSVKEYIAEVN